MLQTLATGRCVRRSSSQIAGKNDLMKFNMKPCADSSDLHIDGNRRCQGMCTQCERSQGWPHQSVVAMREGGPDPLEQARHPCALVVVARLPRAGADAAADHQHVGALACRAQRKGDHGAGSAFSNLVVCGLESQTGSRQALIATLPVDIVLSSSRLPQIASLFGIDAAGAS